MPNEQKNKASDQELVSVTVWLPQETLEKLNKLVLSKSSSKRIANRQEVVRELIEKARL